MTIIEQPIRFDRLNNLLQEEPQINNNNAEYIRRFFASNGRKFCASASAFLYGISATSLASSPTAQNIVLASCLVPTGTFYLALAANESLYQRFKSNMVDFRDRAAGLFRNIVGNENNQGAAVENEDNQNVVFAQFPTTLENINNRAPYKMQISNNQQEGIPNQLRIRNSHSISIRLPELFESNVSEYRLELENFFANIPNNATADEIVTMINSYYNSTNNNVQTFQRYLINEYEASRPENCYIEDSVISKAIFASLVGSCICHGGRLPADNEQDADNLIAKVATISLEQKNSLKTKINQYLENAYTNTLDANKKLFLLEGHKMLNCEEYNNVNGEENFKVILTPRANNNDRNNELENNQHNDLEAGLPLLNSSSPNTIVNNNDPKSSGKNLKNHSNIQTL